MTLSIRSYISILVFAAAFVFSAGLASAQTTTTTTPASRPACRALIRDLTLGARGTDVTALQSALIEEGVSITAGATGYFGPLTRTALAQYQTRNGITPANGYYGPQTREKLRALCLGSGVGSTNGGTSNANGGGVTPPPTANVQGCSFGNIYNTQTGELCVNNSDKTPGCRPGDKFSYLTGQSCAHQEGPDLRVQNVKKFSSDLIANGVSVDLCNAGTTVLATFPLRIIANGVTQNFSFPTANFAPGSCNPQAWEYEAWNMQPEGSYQVLAIADPENVISETSENNNRASALLSSVSPQQYVALSVSGGGVTTSEKEGIAVPAGSSVSVTWSYSGTGSCTLSQVSKSNVKTTLSSNNSGTTSFVPTTNTSGVQVICVANGAIVATNFIFVGIESSTGPIKLSSPNGGEVWTAIDHLTDTSSGNEDYVKHIEWSGIPDTQYVFGATARVRAYLEKVQSGQFITVGRIPAVAKGSIQWVVGIVGNNNCDYYTCSLNSTNFSVVPPGQYYVRVVEDDTNTSDRSDQPFTIVSGTTAAAPIITTTSLPNATVGSSYTESVISVGGTGTRLWSITAGSLPPGISLNHTVCTAIYPSTCTEPATIPFYGTPTTAGTYTFTIRVTVGSQSASKQLSITVGAAAAEASGSLSVSPTSITGSGSATVSWSATGVDSCAVYGKDDGVSYYATYYTGLTGSKSESLSKSRSYTMECFKNGSQALTKTASVTVIPATVVTPAPATTGSFDYTNDGKVDASDVAQLLTIASGSATCASGKFCDINKDGRISSSDALLLNSYIGNASSVGKYDYSDPRDYTIDNADVTYLLSVASGSASCPSGRVCDVNGDGRVTSSDALLLGKYIAAGTVLGASCPVVPGNLTRGLSGPAVTALQAALTRDGETVDTTGFFGPLTLAAVKAFQEKYASEILVPAGLSSGSGYVGPTTRAKLNALGGC